MADKITQLAEQLQDRLGEGLQEITIEAGEVTIEVAPEDLLEVATQLRDLAEFGFEILVDLCGVDYANYGKDEWATEETSGSGFSRGVDAQTAGRLQVVTEDLVVEKPSAPRRFAAVMHLLSVKNNQRLRVRIYAPDDDLPVIPSVTSIWSSADWYEREAFDLYGILFDGHPDLRRLLTDYGFIGHPFRKDFPLTGNVEVIYDPEKQRVVYQPVTIEPRVLVPKVIRAAKVTGPEPVEDDSGAEEAAAAGQAE
ncbi:MAG: NADH-quinone oxidoreductase subunit C [Gammaproteobacteria bacterium]|nr:MAG: NADH-quinone oxidoreductase subunit C [Gammaproteobacteria bacterium]